MPTSGPVGIIVNPLAGRDVRRIAARAALDSPQAKRNAVARAVIGAAAAGARHFLLVREPFQIASGAVENLQIDARFELLDLALGMDAADSARGAEAMRAAGCAALLALGGDGTSRAIARAWRDAPLLPLSTGTNNVFPQRAEATVAGAAVGLVASGGVELAEVATRAKLVEVEIEGEPGDLALVDAVFLVGDDPGSYLPFDPHHLRVALLARAEPGAVGVSPLGGLLDPCGAADEFGVLVECAPAPVSDGGVARTRDLLIPISPGLYRTAHVRAHRRVALGEAVEIRGPGVLAFDGDRARALAAGQRGALRVVRAGPHVIDVERSLRLGARRGLFGGRSWRDPYDAPRDGGCC
jgi:hypothetical protein